MSHITHPDLPMSEHVILRAMWWESGVQARHTDGWHDMHLHARVALAR